MRSVSFRGLALALAAATLLLPSHAHASPARVTLAELGKMITRSLDGVTSFQVVLDSSNGPTSRQHIVEDLVRRGNGFVMYAQMTINGKTQTMVDTSKHICMRSSTSATWNCRYPTSLATSFLSNTDIVAAFKSSGTVLNNITAIGSKTILGQPSIGYNFMATSTSIKFTAHGTFWFAASTGRVVEMTEIGSIHIAGTPALPFTSTVVYSRWNDPTIKLPAVPAS